MEKMLRGMLESGELEFEHNYPNVNGFIQDICFRHYKLQNPDLCFWGDKYPEYTFMMNELVDVFPNAKTVFLVRHPHSCVEALSRKLSDVKKNFGKVTRNIDDCVTQWVAWNQTWLDFKAKSSNVDFLEVRYEDYIEDPGHTLGGLEEFLQIALLGQKQVDAVVTKADQSKLTSHRQSKDFAEIERLCARPDVERLAQTFGYSV